VRMRAITLWQPWASLMACGAKPHETRGWHAPSESIGHWYAIHAASTFRVKLGDGLMPPAILAALAQHYPDQVAIGADLPVGGVIAVGRLVACVETSDPSVAAAPDRPLGDFSAGRWVWRFEDMRPISIVPISGRQRIWYLPDDTQREVEQRGRIS
jgi:hypothetical protein